MMPKRFWLGCASAAALIICASSSSSSDDSTRGDWEGEAIPGYVAPFRAATLGFEQSGRVERLQVEEGAIVEEGDYLAGLTDAVQRARVDIAGLKAQSDLEVQLARVRLAQAERELERTSKLGHSLASAKELADAEATAEARRVEHELALRDLEQARRDLVLQTRLLEQRSLHAPFGGYVHRRLKRPGETVEAGEGLITLIQLDPLVVVLDCHLAYAKLIHVGDRLRVVPADQEWASREGTVTFVAAAADAASQMIRVKLRVRNADRGWLGGMKVYVRVGGADHACDHAAAPRAVTRATGDRDRGAARGK